MAGLPAMSEPAFAQESPTQAPVARSARGCPRGAAGNSGPQTAGAPGIGDAYAAGFHGAARRPPPPADRSAQSRTDRAPRRSRRTCRSRRRRALTPACRRDLATGPVPEPPADRPNVPPPEGVQLGTPVIPPAPPGEPPVIAAVPGLPGERPQSAVPPRQRLPPPRFPPGDLPAGTEFRVVFPDDIAQTLSPADTRLLNGIAARLRQDENTRLEVLGYASGTPETNRESRRLSLERALAVRSYLIDQGVRRTRIDVRALGQTAPQGPADRVDLLLVK